MLRGNYSLASINHTVTKHRQASLSLYLHYFFRSGHLVKGYKSISSLLIRHIFCFSVFLISNLEIDDDL